jgi:hypothetical protein
MTKEPEFRVKFICIASQISFSFLFCFFVHLFTCAYIVGAISSPCPWPPPSSPHPLTSRQNLFCPLLQFCWREDISNNKKDIAFLLAEIRIAIQRDPSTVYMHKCITARIDSFLSDLFITSQSPSHIDLCCFKVTVLAPQQWGHQASQFSSL